MVQQALSAADQLAAEGIEAQVVNARFIKPLDVNLLANVFKTSKFVVSIEEGALAGGYGSAVLEAACEHGWDTRILRTIGIPDRFIEHGDRNELLASVGLDAPSIASTCRKLLDRFHELASIADSHAANV